MGLHDPHQVREQQRHAVAPAQHRQLVVPQRLQVGGAARHAAQHLRQNHPVHRSGGPRYPFWPCSIVVLADLLDLNLKPFTEYWPVLLGVTVGHDRT